MTSRDSQRRAMCERRALRARQTRHDGGVVRVAFVRGEDRVDHPALAALETIGAVHELHDLRPERRHAVAERERVTGAVDERREIVERAMWKAPPADALLAGEDRLRRAEERVGDLRGARRAVEQDGRGMV